MSWIRLGWIAAFALLLGVRLWNGFTGPLLRGYDDHGHVGYVLYLDLYRAVPWADQGWSYFHPPLHYVFGWALARLGSADALLHGLALLNGLWSLAIAWLASRVVRLAHPDREGLALLAFVAVGGLPVYLYTSTMAGNELTAAFFGTAAFALFVANECRREPRLAADAGVGLLFGLALLSKVSAVLGLGAAGLALGLRLLRADRPLAAVPRIALRGAVVAGVALVVAAPYYARNVSEFGTPFKMSRDNEHVARLESQQPPGQRTWVDFVALPPALLLDPNPRSEHLLHSVWGSAYAQTWADTRLSWENLPEAEMPRIEASRSALAILGLGPTALALCGAVLALADVFRSRRRGLYVPLFCLAGVSLASFVYFALAAPQYSALKASYLLGLSLPFAAFLARGVEAVARAAWTAAWGLPLAALLVALPAAVSALVHADGVWLPRLGDHDAVASLRFYFGDREAARQLYQERRRTSLGRGGSWNDELAGVALVDGDPFEARSLLEVWSPKPGRDPLRWNALAVATALAGDLELALARADAAVQAGAAEVGLTNRGAIRAARRELAEAEVDLRAALALDDALAPAWHALAGVLERAQQPDAARAARERARAAARRAPRGYPYGIPDGLGQYPSISLGLRFMLWLEGEGEGEGNGKGEELALAAAPFRPEDAIAMQAPAALFASRPHIVLVVIDTLRADHLGAWGYPRPTSPRIDRLAREGVRFSRTFAPSSWTLPSVASIFTSLAPAEHGATSWGRKLDDADTTFVERLASAGWATLGVSGNFVHVSEKNRFDQGFQSWQTLSFELEAGAGEALLEQKGVRWREPTAREVNAAVFEALPPPSPYPLFLYVHYMEPHSAYDPPEAERLAFASRPEDRNRRDPATSERLAELVRGEERLAPGEAQRLVDLYDAEIATVDAALGELLDGLEARGFGDKLVVAVVADHGEEFGEHGGWFHGLTLYGESLAVPFVLWDSRHREAARVVDAPADLLDVPTTLLGVAGVGRVHGMLGRDLLADTPVFPRPLLASLDRDRLFERHLRPRLHRRSAIHWPWKVLVDRRRVPRVFDLEGDPGEQRPLALGDPRLTPEVRKLASALARPALAGRPGQARKPGPERVPGDEELEQLRALGYAE